MHVFEQLVNSRQVLMSYNEQGVYAYGGNFLAICQGIDEWVVNKAKKAFFCSEERYPAFLPIKEMNRICYLSKFPTMPYVQYPIDNLKEENALKISCDGKAGKIEEDYFIQNHHYLDWGKGQFFNPSTCYHTFLNRKGEVLNEEIEIITAISQCNRNEKIINKNPMRLKNFRMREVVFIGKKELVESNAEFFFDTLKTDIQNLAKNVTTEYSNDMFFGMNAELYKEYQKASKVKKELLMPIDSLGENDENISLACASRNYHNDFLCKAFEIDAKGYSAESACVAIGIERLAYALICNCGMNPKEWCKSDLKEIICSKI